MIPIRRYAAEPSAALAALPKLLQAIYAARGITCADELNYGLAQLARPEGLLHIEPAAQRVADAIIQQQRIAIVGDYDCDGATGTALAMRGLAAFGATQLKYIVPNRFTDGYGLSPALVDRLQDWQPDLLITVDNGVAAIDGVAYAAQLGIDTVITDHHLPGTQLPAAVAMVNPNQPGDGFVSKALAGVGVMFYLLIALKRRLLALGQAVQDVNVAQWLDLVAVGTVADVVALDHNNRILVEQGLRRIRAGYCCPGVSALIEAAKRQQDQLVATDIGFGVGPRLNAAGRLDDMSLGIECLLADEAQRAQKIALQLEGFNQARRELQNDMTAEAQAIVAELPEATAKPALVVYDPAWHEGVIGLLASRLKEQWHKPVLAFAQGENGWLKGSGRAPVGLHLRDALALVDARQPGLIAKFGGHAAAAGLSLQEQHLNEFTENFHLAVAECLPEQGLVNEVLSDGPLTLEQLNLQTEQEVRQAGPWGQGFAEPIFDNEFTVVRRRFVGQNKHLQLWLQLPDSAQTVQAIWFNADEEDAKIDCNQAHVAFRLQQNHYNGQTNLQLMVVTYHPMMG